MGNADSKGGGAHCQIQLRRCGGVVGLWHGLQACCRQDLLVRLLAWVQGHNRTLHWFGGSNLDPVRYVTCMLQQAQWKCCVLAIASACSWAASTSGSSSGFLSSDSWCAKKHTRRLHAKPSVQHCRHTGVASEVAVQRMAESRQTTLPGHITFKFRQDTLPQAQEWCPTGRRCSKTRFGEQQPRQNPQEQSIGARLRSSAPGRSWGPRLRAIPRGVQPALEHAVAEGALIAPPAARALRTQYQHCWPKPSHHLACLHFIAGPVELGRGRCQEVQLALRCMQAT